MFDVDISSSVPFGAPLFYLFFLGTSVWTNSATTVTFLACEKKHQSIEYRVSGRRRREEEGGRRGEEERREEETDRGGAARPAQNDRIKFRPTTHFWC